MSRASFDQRLALPEQRSALPFCPMCQRANAIHIYADEWQWESDRMIGMGGLLMGTGIAPCTMSACTRCVYGDVPIFSRPVEAGTIDLSRPQP